MTIVCYRFHFAAQSALPTPDRAHSVLCRLQDELDGRDVQYEAVFDPDRYDDPVVHEWHDPNHASLLVFLAMECEGDELEILAGEVSSAFKASGMHPYPGIVHSVPQQRAAPAILHRDRGILPLETGGLWSGLRRLWPRHG